MILTKLERKIQNSFGKTTSYNIISMIIVNTNYETIMSLCRKVQIVLQINSQSRQNYKKYGKTYVYKKIVEKIDIYCTNMFLLPSIIDTIEVTNSLLCRNTQYYGGTRCVVNELAERPKFRRDEGEAATLSLTHWDSTPRPLDRQSRALTTELERATCGKLRCRGPFSSFLANPFIRFECYSNIERINEGIISNAKHEHNAEIRKPLSRSANERISDGHVLRLAYGMPTFARVVSSR